MMFEVFAGTDKGLKRPGNEDAYLINRELGLFIVADGMGGHEGGEIASSLAVRTAQETVQQLLFNQHSRPLEVVQKAFERANEEIFDKASRDKNLQGMGTTMVLGLVWKNVFYLGNVGDSRAYLYRPPYLWQITNDHSWIAEQQRHGGISGLQVNVGRNVITRSVGFEPHIIVDIFERPIQNQDHFLLCTDGLHSLVEDAVIADILNRTPIEKAVDALIQEALKNGGSDNVTILLVKFYGS